MSTDNKPATPPARIVELIGSLRTFDTFMARMEAVYGVEEVPLPAETFLPYLFLRLEGATHAEAADVTIAAAQATVAEADKVGRQREKELAELVAKMRAK